MAIIAKLVNILPKDIKPSNPGPIMMTGFVARISEAFASILMRIGIGVFAFP